MKKKLICGLMAGILGILPLIPEGASASETNPADIDNDGVVCYEDFNTIKDAFNNDKSYDSNLDVNKDGVFDFVDVVMVKDQIKETGVTGDINGDGVVSLEDFNLFTRVIRNGKYKQITENGKYIVVYDGGSEYSFDAKNGDTNGDGYFGPDDLTAFEQKYDPKATGIKGDVNDDGVVDQKDLNLLKKNLLEDDYRIDGANADVNGDKSVDILDYSQLRHMINTNK